MGKLESLTAEQEQKSLEVRDWWIDYIDSCAHSTNKDQAKIGIDWMYAGINKKSPMVVFVSSPMGCQIAVHYLKHMSSASVGASVRASVWASVRDSVWASVWASVRDSVGDSVRASVRDSVGDSVRDSVGASVWASVWASVRDSVGDSVRASVGASVRASVRDSVGDSVWASVRDSVWDSVGDSDMKFEAFASYGSVSDYGWVSFYDFFTRIGVINHDGFNKFKNILTSGVYDMIQMEGVCVVSDMPCKLKRNQNGQMHCVDGFAIEFRDGYGQHYINGREMPRWIFEEYGKEGFFNRFVSEQNEDVKAGIITMIKERAGNEGLLKFLGAELVDEKEIQHFEDYSETIRLYKTKERYPFLQDRHGKSNQPYCWSEITCPSTGSVYLIDNSADFTCAKEAVEFLRPSFVPEGLEYRWEHSAN